MEISDNGRTSLWMVCLCRRREKENFNRVKLRACDMTECRAPRIKRVKLRRKVTLGKSGESRDVTRSPKMA